MLKKIFIAIVIILIAVLSTAATYQYSSKLKNTNPILPPETGVVSDKATTTHFDMVANNFEGEADPKRMTLNMHPWTWFTTNYSDGKKVTPLPGKNFSITFTNKNTFSAKTDCNGVGGEYSVVGNKITFKNMITTMMYCEGSQESDFTKMLSETQSYMFTSKGELVLGLKFDSGSMMFR